LIRTKFADGASNSCRLSDMSMPSANLSSLTEPNSF
jgi:hypothetical protein